MCVCVCVLCVPISSFLQQTAIGQLSAVEINLKTAQSASPVHLCRPILCSDTGPPLEQRRDIPLSPRRTGAAGPGWSAVQWCSVLCTGSGPARPAAAPHLHQNAPYRTHSGVFHAETVATAVIAPRGIINVTPVQGRWMM